MSVISSAASDHVGRLRGLLDLARAVRDDVGLHGVLDSVARTVADVLQMGTVVVNLHRAAEDDFVVSNVVGSPVAADLLTGTSSVWDDWSPLLDERFRHGGTYLVLDGELDWEAHSAPSYIPPVVALDSADGWSANDALFAVLSAADGSTLGILSVDEPCSGRRPTEAERELLDVVAAHAALAIDVAQSAARQRHYEQALTRLLSHSARLAHVLDAPAALRTLSEAVSEALGFRRVEAWLADDERGLRRMVAASPEDGEGRVTFKCVERLLAAAPAVEGCHLLEGQAIRSLEAERHEEVAPAPSILAAVGPKAWRDHGLVVPLRAADGALVGMLLVRDPADRLLPAAEALRAMRIFANQAAVAIEGRQALRALNESEARAAAVLRSAMDAVVTIDASGCILSLNPAAERMFGSADALAGRNVADVLVPPRKRERHRKGFAHALAHGDDSIFGRHIETHLVGVSGAEVPVEMSLARASTVNGSIYVAFIRDISSRLNTERALRDERDRAQRYLDVAETMIVVLDDCGRLTLLNKKGCEVLGYDEHELLGRDWFEHAVPDGEQEATRLTYAQIMGGKLDHAEYHENHVRRRDGELRLIAWHNTRLRDPDGTVTGSLSSGQDVTEQRRAEARVAHLAFHDTLTSLPNRAQLEEKLDAALLRARCGGRALALLFVDLDDFKLVNDSFGHAAGDELLRAVSERLRLLTRADDTLARHGGDEFLLLLEQLPGDGVIAAQAIADKLLQAFEHPFTVGGAELWIGASVGVSLFPRDADTQDGLLRNADVALYQAKADGRGRHELYRRSGVDPRTRLGLGVRLRRALDHDEFELHYQPIVDLAANRIVAVEALLRWRQTDGSYVPPGDFIPLAEESGLIEPIGEWVIREATKQAGAWRAQGLSLRVSFNLSSRQLLRADLLPVIAASLHEHAVPAEMLTAEITETALMRDPDRAQCVLSDLRELGVQLALDDFGAAYSSLARLRDLPVDMLKIDREFLRRVPEDAASCRIVRAIVALAAGLDRTAVAEGVERREQLAFLRAAGCTLAQGYHLGRPVPAAHIAPLTTSRAFMA